MRYTGFFTCSLFSIPSFLFPVPCSLFPVPCSLFPKIPKILPHSYDNCYRFKSQIQTLYFS
ncbi:hypothetical protein [Moorena sp. SIO3H5]|uniref:hypothetical protein n=1 Tax=Moorena sp. SIO3H5 TaxID=2607834 RepID=UPI0013B85064|nr:hypothetical protein [Moorena sp. SIO3H5]NEO73097.1 hypothetical protein [Moorena sp. SIO3H5]